MSSRSRQSDHQRYKNTINELLEQYDAATEDESPELQSHHAKYLAVLVSGYLEQAIKELMLGYASNLSNESILRYITNTWPSSKNMRTGAINEILGHFNQSWSERFTDWLNQDDSRKNDINSIVKWRNSIAHGEESNTTGVTLNSVSQKFGTATELVSFIEAISNE